MVGAGEEAPGRPVGPLTLVTACLLLPAPPADAAPPATRRLLGPGGEDKGNKGGDSQTQSGGGGSGSSSARRVTRWEAVESAVGTKKKGGHGLNSTSAKHLEDKARGC